MLQAKFNQTAPEFQAQIKAIADKFKKPVLDVYALWREYSETCRLYDQSPVLFEFENWYQVDLSK